MSNSHLSTGSIWRLYRGEQELARLRVTDVDWPWMYASVEALPGFEEFLPLFADQGRAADAGDWERADECQLAIRSALTMTFPIGNPVAEFLLHIHNDGTAGWRWHDEPFDTPGA
jgi:hypothetical protein